MIEQDFDDGTTGRVSVLEDLHVATGIRPGYTISSGMRRPASMRQRGRGFDFIQMAGTRSSSELFAWTVSNHKSLQHLKQQSANRPKGKTISPVLSRFRTLLTTPPRSEPRPRPRSRGSPLTRSVRALHRRASKDSRRRSSFQQVRGTPRTMQH